MTTTKFLFVSEMASISDIAWRCLQEGHEVRMAIQTEEDKDVADGFVPKSADWRADIDWADVIVFDDTLGAGKHAERLRKHGKAVIGGTSYTDRLEDDRSFGQEELLRHGIPILSYQTFDDFDRAIEHVRTHPGKYVIKPGSDVSKRLLFVGIEEDGSDVIRVLEAYKRVWAKQMKVFQLQKKVSGVEIAVGAFFDGQRFLEPINVNFEHKKLFPGNLGPSTGEMGSSMFWSGKNKLFNATLQKFEETLAREQYVGYIDLNCIVNSNGIYPLEFTSRFGFPTISVQQEGMITPIGDFLRRLAHREPIELKVKKGFQTGVRVVVPPFPFRDIKTFKSYSLGATIVFKKKNLDGIHIEDVKLVNGQWVMAGNVGVALIVAGCGQTMREAQRQAYNRVQNILIPNMYYRDDIGDRWHEDTDKLHTWGYLREN